MSTAELHPAEVLAYLKTSRRANHKGRSVFDRLYSIYLALIGVVAIGIFSSGSLRNHPFSPETAASVRARLPFILAALFCLVVIGVLRFATWQGPVSFSRPDVPFLLGAPLSRRALVAPKLISSLIVAAAAGAASGLILFVFLEAKLRPDAGPLLGAALAGPALLGLLVIALSWHVEASIRRARWVVRWGWILFVLALAFALGSRDPSMDLSAVALWSGPWGWAAAPVVAASGGAAAMWPVTLGLLSVAAAAASFGALRAADAASIEELARRAGLRSGLSAALYVQDFRGLAMLGRDARRALFMPRKRKIRHPRRALLVIPWRDSLALLRAPSRIVWATALVAAAALVAGASAGHPGGVVLAILLSYLAAARLVETVRQEADDTDAAGRFPWAFGDVVLMHAVVPAVALAVLGAAAIGVATLDGVLTGSEAGLSLGLVALGAPMLIMCAVGVAQRGRLPIELIFYGSEVVFLWYAAGPLLALVSLGIPVASMIGNFHSGLAMSQASSSAAFFLAIGLALGITVLRRRQPKVV